MKVDVQKFLARLALSGYGTGTLATAAKVHPDAIQKMIALGEAPDDLVSALAARIGWEWVCACPPAPAHKPKPKPKIPSVVKLHKMTAPMIRRLVLAGEITAAEALEAELKRPKPRPGLVCWLEGQKE